MDGELSEPSGIAINRSPAGDIVYVADSGNNRAQQFTTNGEFVNKWGSVGNGPGQFNNSLADIDVDPSTGNLYKIEVSGEVQKFTGAGQFIMTWGSFGDCDGQFTTADGIAIDDMGNVFVNDWNGSKVNKFTSDGKFVTSFGSEGSRDGQIS